MPGAIIVARDDFLDPVVAAARDAGSVHRFASRVPGARELHGRGTAYAVTLPGTAVPVVVRHNRHGGAFRSLTGDLFLMPTRAPFELETSLELLERRIPTPPVLAYAVYPAGAGLARSDVVTQEIQASSDLGSVLLSTDRDGPERRYAWEATIELIDRLVAAGARHHDLNVKNVLTAPGTAFVLDVDRVELGLSPRAACDGNYRRLARSVEKWRRMRGARVTDAEIERLRRKATSIP